MLDIRQMEPELSLYSVGGVAYADVDKIVFGKDSVSLSSLNSDDDGEDDGSTDDRSIDDDIDIDDH